MAERADRQLLDRIRATAPPGARILDLPAGDGHFSALLAEAGFSPVPSDLFPENCARAPVSAVPADMNHPLPFEDDAFDAIVSQEGIEHLENLPCFLRECRRLLKPDGHIYLTVPNWMDLSSRVHFLFAGTKGRRAGLVNEQSTVWGRDGDRVYHGHAFALPWFQIRYLLRIAQFDDLAFEARGWSTSSRVLYPFLRPLVGLALGVELRARQKRDRRKGKPAIDDSLRKQLHREGVSKHLLCGKGLLIHGRLREGSY